MDAELNAEAREELVIEVERVIGTGDPLDGIMLIPLRHEWGVPAECLMNLSTPCQAPLRRLYVLKTPLQGHSVVGVCEQHHQEFYTKPDTHWEIDR